MDKKGCKCGFERGASPYKSSLQFHWRITGIQEQNFGENDPKNAHLALSK